MTRADLVDKISAKLGLTKKDVEDVIEETIHSLYETLRGGGKVTLRGLGVFSVRNRKPRAARNPKTGAAVMVPAKRAPHFKPGKELKEAVNVPGPEPAAGA